MEDRASTPGGGVPQGANRRILRATLIVALLTLFVRAFGVIKEPVTAAFFGTSGEMDAFLIAFLLPNFLINITSSAFSSAFIPAYFQEAERRGEKAAEDFLAGALTLSLTLLSLGALLVLLGAPLFLPALGSELSPEQIELSGKLLFILLPSLVVKGASTLWASILNSRERFAVAALVPASIPICVLAAIFAWGRELGVVSLAAGTLAGYVLEALLLMGALKRRGIAVRPRLRPLDAPMRAALGQYAPILAGAAVVSGATLVDQGMAASLGQGQVSSLHYGLKLPAVIAGIAATGLGTAILPYFSRLSAAGDQRGMRQTLATWIRRVLLFSLPCTAVLFYYTEDLVRLLYERGRFTASDTGLVSDVMRMYVLYVPTFLLGTVLARFLSALRRNGVLMQAAALSLPLNAFLNYVLMQRIGLKGIALSTSIIYLVTLLYTGAATLRALGTFGRPNLSSEG